MRLLRGIVAGLALSLGFVAARADDALPPPAPAPTDWAAVPTIGMRKAIADGKLVAVDAKTGRSRLKTDLAADGLKAFDVDPRTGDIAFVAGEKFRWLHADDGRQEPIVPR